MLALHYWGGHGHGEGRGGLNLPKARRQLNAYSAHFFALQEMVYAKEFTDGEQIVASDYVAGTEV